MRNSPAVRRAPVHQFADGAAKHVPKRSVDQALKHETVTAVGEGDSDGTALVVDSSDQDRWTPSPEILLRTQTGVASITLRPVTTEDVDQLWDWSRTDAEGVSAVFGRSFANSRELFTAIGRLAELERLGSAWMQAITRDATLIGFVLIAPIQRPTNQPPVGTVHLYIAASERGDLGSVVTSMLADFDAKHPPMTLSVIVSRPEWSAILEPLGFASTTVLTRPALKPDGSTWA